MNSLPTQIQLKLSLSPQLNDLLQAKADNFGVPITQFVKHLIIREVENSHYPTFRASTWTQNRVQEAIDSEGEATSVDSKDLHKFFDDLK